MTFLKPLVKWVGGKRQLLPQIHAALPQQGYSTYFEPFFGGGAVLWSLAPEKAVVNDLNMELINLYTVVRDDVEALIAELQNYPNDEAFFYELRAIDRDTTKFALLSGVKRAARTVYLNKTCYNGLYRVNLAGQFNSPFGRYKKPLICDVKTLRGVSEYLNSNEVTFLNGDFKDSVATAQPGDFVYFDPPYDPVNITSNFVGYAAGGFGRNNQVELKELCDDLTDRGVNWMLSNSATNFIRDLYSDYHVDIVGASRAINSIASKRGKVDEVLVRNYEK